MTVLKKTQNRKIKCSYMKAKRDRKEAKSYDNGNEKTQENI